MKPRPTRDALAALARGARPLLALRWVRVVLLVGALALLLRLTLGLLLGSAIDSAIESRGLACAWGDLDLSILSGRGEVRDLRFTPLAKDGSGAAPEEPIVVVDYAVFDLQLLPLFVGKLRVQRLEIDGAEVRIARTADGTWNLARHLATSGGDVEPAPVESEEATEKTRSIVLAPPFSVEALRFQDVYLRLTDRFFEPAIERVFHFDAAVSNLWSTDRRTRWSVTLTGDKLLDGAHVEGEGDWTSERIALDLRAQLGGLRPPAIAPYLDAVGIRPACEAIAGRFAAHVELAVTGPAHDVLHGSAELSDLNLSADEVESVALDRALLEIGSFSSAGASIPRIEIDGLRAKASIEASQALRVVGLDVSPASRETVPSSQLQPLSGFFDLWAGGRVPAWAALFVRDDPHAFPWKLGSFALRRGEVRLSDRRVEPSVVFPVFVDEIDVHDVVHERGPGAGSQAPISVHVAMRVPGTADSIRIDGSIGPFVPDRSIDLELVADGLGFDAMTGYLRSAGLEDTHQRGGLRIQLVGSATSDANGVTDGQLQLEESLTLDGVQASQIGRVQARELHLDPVSRSLRLGDIEISGTRILAGRDPSRRMAAFGLRTLGLGAAPARTAKPRAPVAAQAAAPVAAVGPLPRIEIGRVAWTDSHLSFLDEVQDPPVRIAIEPIRFELTGLVVGGAPGADPPPARLVASAVAPGLFDAFAVEGEIRSKLGGIDLATDLVLSGSGLQGKLAAPYLRALGIEPALVAARADLRIHAELRHDGAWRGSVRLHAGELTDGVMTIAKLGELRVDDVADLPAGLSIGRVSIVEPFVHIERSKGNTIQAGGLRYVGARSEERSAPAAAPAPLEFPVLPPMRLVEFSLRGAHVSLHDDSVEPAVDADLFLDASARNVSTSGERGEFSATLRIPGTFESLEARGGVVLGPTILRADVSIDGRGAKNGPLARLLPPGTKFEMLDGRLALAGSAEIGSASVGGIRARMEAHDLAWRDGESEPLLACRSASLAIPRFDPGEGVVEIGPASVEGLTIDADRDAHGALGLLGFRIENVRAPESPAAEEKPEPGTRALARVRARIGLAGDLAFVLDRFRFRDATLGETARPLEVGLALRVPGPLEIRGGDPQALPPIVWSLEASVRGLVENLRIDGSLQPFADEPAFDARLSATGVRTQGLVELVPALGGAFQGDVEAGTLEGHLAAQLEVKRRERTDLGFDRPFGGEIRLEGLAFRASPQGDVLAGVESIAVDVAKVDLAHDLVHVKSVEVVRPRALARRIGTSLSVFGLALDLAPPPASAAASASKEPPPAEEAAAAPRTVDETPSTSELRIDRVLVSGVDAELRDTTRDPPVVVPLVGLDVEAGPLSTLALREPRPIRFHVVVAAGAPTSVGAEGQAIGSKAAPIFDELVLAGDVKLRPEPSGWVQLSLTGLELPEVAALVPPQSVAVDEGALDFRVRATLKGDAGANIQARLVFTDLSVTEAQGGPIESGLALPVTLDAALFLLRNPAGEHRVSVGFTVDRNGVGGGQIAIAATEAIAQVLGVALASAPLRLLTAFAPKSDAKARGPKAVREVSFAAGSSDIPPDTQAKLFYLRQQFANNSSWSLVVRHELAAGDLERAESLANPTAAECLALVARGRQRKAELLRARAEAATQARTLLAVGARTAEEATGAFRAVDRELASVEDALDGVLDILRSPSPRQSRKRTRVTALEIAQARLDGVANLLRAGLDAEVTERFEVRAPRLDVVPGLEAGRIVIELRER